MHIVQIVPNWNKFLPTTVVGIRGVVKDLCLGLQEKGHTVTLVAARGSEFPTINIKETTIDTASLGLSSKDTQSWSYRVAHAAEAISLLKDADVVHSHLEHVLLPFTPFIDQPLVHTLHSIDYNPEDKFLFREFPVGKFVAISQRHRELVSVFAPVTDVCYNGIDAEIYRIENHPEKYLLWIGRYVPEKGADAMVTIAQETGFQTILAGFVNKKYAGYYNQIKQKEQVGKFEVYNESLGEEKIKLLQKAKAFLTPITWEEPFGLTMIEAMACGTPVIAYNRGSVAEIVEDGVTGFIIEPEQSSKNQSSKSAHSHKWQIKKTGIAGFVEAVRRIDEIDRLACRKRVAEQFTVAKMVDRYLALYEELVHSR